MGKLSKQILAARESDVTVGEWTFTIRRPDAMTTSLWAGLDGVSLAEKILGSCVVGWRGVLERDVLGAGGGDLPVEFDPEDFLVWSRDRPDVWGPIVGEVMRVVSDYTDKLEVSRKN
jgi:hypothetical protein